jgi:WD40 repeat protein
MPTHSLDFMLSDDYFAEDTQVSWSPDGLYLAIAQGATWVVETRGWQPRIQYDQYYLSPILSMAWSPQTYELATATQDGRTYIIPPQQMNWDDYPQTYVRSAAADILWTADGQTLIVGDAEGSISLFEAQDYTLIDTWDERADDGVSVTGLALSPDGTRLAASFAPQNTAEIMVWDMASKNVLLEINTAHGDPTDIAWSPDGAILAVSFGFTEVWGYRRSSGGWTVPGLVALYDAQTGREIAVLTGHTASVTDIAFAADGRLASASADGTILIWKIGE